MGKRELLLVLGFVIVGAIVYQATAPPGRPGERGFSIRELLQDLRRALRGQPDFADFSAAATLAAIPAHHELRVPTFVGRLQIAGEDRPDVAAEIRGRVRGADPAEARARAARTGIRLDSRGDAIEVRLDAPPGARPNNLELALRTPRRLAVRFDVSGGPGVDIRGVASVQMEVVRANVTIEEIAGAVRGEQRDGELGITVVGSLRLVLRRVEGRIARVAGESVLEASDGELTIEAPGSELRVDSRRTRIQVAGGRGMARINASDGSVRLENQRAEVRVDAQRAAVTIRLATPVPLEASTTDEPLDVFALAGSGFTLDAVAREGRIRIEPPVVAVTPAGSDQHARGQVGQGGPQITLRNTRAGIALRLER